MSKTTLISNSVSINNGNVDFFSAERSLGKRVSEFMFCVVKRDEVNTEYKNKITSLKESLANLKNLEGSIMAGQIPALEAAAYTQIEQFEAERQELLDKQAKFAYTDFEKEFKKSLNKGLAEDEISELVSQWFDHYGLNVRDTYFLQEVLGTFGSKVHSKTVVRSDGKKCMKVDSANALKNIYGVTYEHLVQVGIIKTVDIPQLLRDKYAPKSNKGKRQKKNKKGGETK